ncbi:hypothetical protein J2W94_001494 [Pseudoxanthomonas sacheonensis]|uniref:Uncharacterized protein n=1 Tax=Pseudoxanthomonas sacheonensis TaxID=443615 RepID=A0ABU1RR10_9GAMM|nr:hypothetical protein [Pseudoxanthomonas sacheonensis]
MDSSAVAGTNPTSSSNANGIVAVGIAAISEALRMRIEGMNMGRVA